MRVALFNVNPAGHAGMRAIARAVEHLLRHVETTQVLSEADAVVVNGEGTLHHNVERARFLMYALRTAQDCGIKTYLINTVYQMAGDYDETLKRLDYLSVREPLSYRAAAAGNPALLPDLCCFDPELSNGRLLDKLPAIVVGDMPYSQVTYLQAANMIQAWFPEIRPARLPLDYAFPDIVATLKHSQSVYITGQHHGIYAAALAGVPFVPLPSNSWKIEGLLEWFHEITGVCVPLVLSKAEIRDGVEFARDNRRAFSDFGEWLRSQKLNDLFERIAA